MATTTRAAATPWGRAKVVDQVTLDQRIGEKRFSSFIQLLEGAKGEQYVRFAYATAGSARRGGPVTLRLRDLEKMRASLAKHPALASALGFGGEA